MNIREKCLIHTELTSDQIATLEKMVEYFVLLNYYYEKLAIVLAGKRRQEALVISSKQAFEAMYCTDEKLTAWLDYPGGNACVDESGQQVVPFYLGGENRVGVVLCQEKTVYPPQSPPNMADLGLQCAAAGYPVNYLIPDGIVLIDSSGEIQYANEIAAIIFSRLGVRGLPFKALLSALGMRLESFEDFLKRPVFLGFYRQIEHFDVSFVVNPLFTKAGLAGALVIISDISPIKKKEKELMEKSTVIKEIHHRVKNNLQTITSLLRLQMRRTNVKLVEKVFNESINRIMSIALIHEALSKQNLEFVNIKQTSYSILQMILSNMVEPDKNIKGEISGDDVYLSATLASSVSLCVTELIQNAVEHAFVDRVEGNIRVAVEQSKDEIIITVRDNGIGVTPAKVKSEGSLGMQIVHTIITSTLKGSFILEGRRYGTVASIRFPKSNLEGVEL